jgi:hypothetical protein
MPEAGTRLQLGSPIDWPRLAKSGLSMSPS